MAALLSLVTSVFEVVLAPAFLHMLGVFQQASNQGFFHAIGQASLAFASELSRRVLDSVPSGLEAFKRNFAPMVRLVLAGLYTVLVVSIPAILVWLRRLERGTPITTRPQSISAKCAR
jgi:hypothetical protein